MLLNAIAVFLLVTTIGCSDGPDHDVALACERDADCETGLCYTQSNPGYCTASCQNEGSTAQCPDFTICKRVQGGPALCILRCDAQGQCPDNSNCTAVPGSDLSACEPVR